MFSVPRPNVIVSDAGFSVEVLGRTGLLYAEQDHRMRIDSEVLMGPKAMVIYRDSISSWLPPHNDQPVDGPVKERIERNLLCAFSSRGLEVGFE